MREFSYKTLPSELMRPEITKLVSALREFRGKQALYLEARPEVLSALLASAKIQSIDASNRIEGIYTSDERLKKLVKEIAAPLNRKEEEIAGYRDVLATIHESYEHIAPTPSIILQLHRDLYRYTSAAFAGAWKDVDNVIAEISPEGERIIRFKPLSAIATPHAVQLLCDAYQEALREDVYDSLLLTCMFVFDLICIHPFNDGNGRMSRLLTLLLLYRSGYQVGKFISIEKLIEQSKETYYEALAASSAGWEEGKNDYTPFVRYLLGTITAAYREFSDRVGGLVSGKKSKPERIEDFFNRRVGKISKSDILEGLPDISTITVERTLAQLFKQGKIVKVGGGRSTAYVKAGNGEHVKGSSCSHDTGYD
jgi:Fic family protein